MSDRRFLEHPLRAHVVGEMQLRREPAFSVPAQIVQLVRLLDPAARKAEETALTVMPGEQWHGSQPRHRETRVRNDTCIFWEQHSEASTVTVVLTGRQADPIGQQSDDAVAIALGWAESLPGSVIRAMRLTIVADEAAARPVVAGSGFLTTQLVTCHVGGGARIWTDFRIHDDGYGRLVIAANDLLPGDLARCVQRLQELGNYRNLALLGLPQARAAWKVLDRLEIALEEAGQDLAAKYASDDTLLEIFTRLSAELLSIDSNSSYRMSATAAYGRIVASRLAELDVRPIAGHSSLADFTERRLWPAVRTCAALTDRLALLNRRASQFTALLRTRIETHIEHQNGRLLLSMDRSARTHLQLQQLVEGLSTVAVSYYALGLLSYPFKAVEKHWAGTSATVLLGVAMPAVVILVSHLIHRAKKRVVSSDNPHDPCA